MIGADRITGKIISDAESDARERLAAAQGECDRINAEYRALADELRERMLSEAESDAENYIARAKSQAAVEK